MNLKNPSGEDDFPGEFYKCIKKGNMNFTLFQNMDSTTYIMIPNLSWYQNQINMIKNKNY